VGKTLSLSEVKTRLPELVAGVHECEEVVVTKNGRAAAILINGDEYTRLKETLDALSDPVLMKQVGRSQSFYKTGKKGSRLRTCLVSHSPSSRHAARCESVSPKHSPVCHARSTRSNFVVPDLAGEVCPEALITPG